MAWQISDVVTSGIQSRNTNHLVRILTTHTWIWTCLCTYSQSVCVCVCVCVRRCQIINAHTFCYISKTGISHHETETINSLHRKIDFKIANRQWGFLFLWCEPSPLCWSNYIIRKYVLPIWSEHNYIFSYRIVHWVYNYMFRPCVSAIVRLYCKLNKQLYNMCVGYSGGKEISSYSNGWDGFGPLWTGVNIV